MEDRDSAIREEASIARRKLEMDSVLELVAARARSERAAEAVRSSSPLGPIRLIEESQAEVFELSGLHSTGEGIPLSDWNDTSGILGRISARGALATGEELFRIAAGEISAQQVLRYIAGRREELPLLSHLQGLFRGRNDLARKIIGTIGPDFEVLDTASPELARIRRQSASLRNRLRKDFADFAAKHGQGKGYEFVTVRGDRYVVSLPRNEAAGVRGIIHQASSSGASLYIEPLDFVEKNNELESLREDEKRETAKILAGLTNEVFEARTDLAGNQDLLLRLDILSAKASFACDFRCTTAGHSADGSMILREARHPLLERKLSATGGRGDVVGLDIECPSSLSVLVISGPNAGGKTVALKTIGLIVLMDRFGLPVPCLTGSVLPDHPGIFVDIGDDQSIEQSLSTFSSRIARINRILSLALKDSLVLIDEIGDGTDPEEGAAIGCALLDELSSTGCRTIVTTHLSALKGWAHEKAGAENATLEFDNERFEPLFRMKMGMPGRSWGIEMAARMGLPEKIVEGARKGMEGNSLRLEQLLAHLDETQRLLDAGGKELAERNEELSRLVSGYRERIDSFEKNRESMLREAKKEALDIVMSTRVELEKLVREIKVAQAEKTVIKKARQALSEKKEIFEKELAAVEALPELAPGQIKAGAMARIKSLARDGRIVSVRENSRVLVELPGGLRVETGCEDLSAPGEKKAKKPMNKVTWKTSESEPVSTELMIRGLEKVEALEEVDLFIDRAVLQGLDTVRIIHGIGRGILRQAVYDMLKTDPRVADIRPGEAAVGGDGVAVVRLR